MATEAYETASLAREVLQLRVWQLGLNETLQRNPFPVPVHLAIGHEALAVAVHHAMEERDQLALTHRNVAYNLARAGQLESAIEEYRHGSGGSMNLTQRSRGVVYTSSILANNLPVACGLALAAGPDTVVWALTGDGAMEEGAFYESLVFARSHDLRVLFLIENNDHSLGSTIEERRCTIDVSGLCDSIAIPSMGLDGNDAAAYLSRLRQMRRLASIAGPCCVEAMVTTFNQHAGPTPGWPTDPKRITVLDWPALEATQRDPAFVAAGQVPAKQLEELTQQILSLAEHIRNA